MNTIRIPAGRSLDPYLHLHRDPTHFLLEPGEYTTRGAWGFVGGEDVCMVPAGSILEGAGSNRTLVRLDQPLALPGSGYLEALTGGSRSGASPSLTLSGFTLDVSVSPTPVVALHLWSDEPSVHDVSVLGVWGDRTPAAPGSPCEGFGILVNRAGSSRRDGGGLVRSCHVQARVHPLDSNRENYTCAIYLGIVRQRTVPCLRSRVTGCRAGGPRTGSVHAAFAANDFTEVDDCSCDDSFIRGWFGDTSGGEDIRISGCDFESTYAAVDLESGRADWAWRKVSLNDCRLSLAGHPTADHVVGMVLEDLTSSRPQAGTLAEFRSIRLTRCRLVNRSGNRGFLAGLSAARTSDCGLTDCQLVGRWDPPVRANGVAADAFDAAPLL